MQSSLTRYLTEAQQRSLLNTIKSHANVLARRDFHWIRLLRDTGQRIGEFSLTTYRDARFALETGWIFIPKDRRKGRKGKRKDHQVPVTAPVRESLKALLAIHTEMGGDGADDSPLVLSREGNAMAIRTYEERMGAWCRVAGIELASPHWLRHTRAMNVMRKSEAKDPRGIVKALLGHETIASTGIYTGVTKEEILEAARRTDGGRPRRRQVGRLYAQGRTS